MTPSDYPARLVRERRLADGRSVTIRPVRADDGERVRAFLAAASDDARYKRFQKWIDVPSTRLVEFLTDIDYDRHLALVCASGSGAEEQIVGEARYSANPDGASCDFGILILDAWQRTGIAGILMDALIRAARERGFALMESIVLANNAAMLRFAHALGFDVAPIEGDLTTVRIERRLQRVRACAPREGGA
jgi:acetyltransferase